MKTFNEILHECKIKSFGEILRETEENSEIVNPKVKHAIDAYENTQPFIAEDGEVIYPNTKGKYVDMVSEPPPAPRLPFDQQLKNHLRRQGFT